jgi:hypothetical protein
MPGGGLSKMYRQAASSRFINDSSPSWLRIIARKCVGLIQEGRIHREH